LGDHLNNCGPFVELEVLNIQFLVPVSAL